MLRNLTGLNGYTVRAVDGALGKVLDFYFNDAYWVVRYLVVDTKPWFPRWGRRVLISPVMVDKIDWEQRSFHVKLTTDQVRNSPSVDTDQPVSRQIEDELARHYGWPMEWNTDGTPTKTGRERAEKAVIARSDDPYGSSIRSAKEVTGYTIEALDGAIGHVLDLIVDDGWGVRYMVVDTRDWLPGKRVLIAPQWIERVSWSERTVHVDLSQEGIRQSPAYDPTAPVNRQYEARLYDYYGRPKYWVGTEA
jgi:hypothetical protein